MKKTVKTAVIKSGILAMILIWIAGCSKQDENQRSVENENAVEQVLEQQIQGSITADENSDNSETDNRNDAEYENTSETEDEIGLPGVTSSTATASSSELSGEIDIDLIGMGSELSNLLFSSISEGSTKSSFLTEMKNYIKESILGPLFKLLEATFELIVPLVVADIIKTGIAAGDKNYVITRVLILVLLGVVEIGSFNLYDILRFIFPIHMKHYWFVTAYVILLLFVLV